MVVLGLALLVAVVAIPLAWNAVPSVQATCSTSPNTPLMVTDKADYMPGEVVIYPAAVLRAMRVRPYRRT